MIAQEGRAIYSSLLFDLPEILSNETSCAAIRLPSTHPHGTLGLARTVQSIPRVQGSKSVLPCKAPNRYNDMQIRLDWETHTLLP